MASGRQVTLPPLSELTKPRGAVAAMANGKQKQDRNPKPFDSYRVRRNSLLRRSEDPGILHATLVQRLEQ